MDHNNKPLFPPSTVRSQDDPDTEPRPPRRTKKISVDNAKFERCEKVIKLDFKEVAKLPPSFSFDDVKNFTKQLITVLRDMPHSVNKTDGMADILILTPQEV